MAAANGFAGVVVSGSGATYQVALVGSGTVSVTIIQIDVGETLPPGTGLLVVYVGGTYYAQPPVWLGDSP